MLKANNYDIESGERSVFDQELKRERGLGGFLLLKLTGMKVYGMTPADLPLELHAG